MEAGQRAVEYSRRAVEYSRRAVDAYRKTLLVDKVTSDDERSPPVYLLEEISDILRSCSQELTQEIVEYAFRRLRHPNPQVKHKVLRFIKYTVNRAGSAAYRKELQSYSTSIRKLFDFQGQVDPFTGNSLNQAVRDAAHEALKAIFSSDMSPPTFRSTKNRIEGSTKNRIEGFGSGNILKSFGSSERSAGIDETARGGFQHYDGNGYDSRTCKQDEGRKLQEDMEEKPSWRNSGREIFNAQSEKVAFPEDRLLDNVTAPQGLRLQPTRESLQSFLTSAKTLDAVKIARALKAKLQSPSWQVRLKAMCVLQALLLQKDASLLQAVEADYGDFQGCARECLLSSQTTLRKKAKEALDILLALEKVKNCEGSLTILANDTSPIIKTCDEPFFTIEPNQEDCRDAGLLSPTPTTTSDTHQQAVDFLSFQTDDFAQVQAAESSHNFVVDDPFDGMCIHGFHESAGIHVEDLLSGGWAHDSVHQEKAPFGSLANQQTSTVLSTALQSDAIKQSQHKTTVLDNVFISDFTSKSFSSTGKSATSSLDSKIFLAQSPGPSLQNLNALHMFPTGMSGPLHNIAALQQCPAGLQGFQFGLNISGTVFNEKAAVGGHGLGNTHFKEFGLSS